jgi:hypothetical protein
MTVSDIRRTAEPICQRHQVPRLELFGSRARSETEADSDMDGRTREWLQGILDQAIEIQTFTEEMCFESYQYSNCKI